MSDHQHPPLFLGEMHQVLGVFAGGRERLFDEHVLVGEEGFSSQAGVGANRRDDGDRVHIL